MKNEIFKAGFVVVFIVRSVGSHCQVPNVRPHAYKTPAVVFWLQSSFFLSNSIMFSQKM